MKSIVNLLILILITINAHSQDGQVIKIIDNTSIEINIGTKNNVQVGDVYKIIGKGQKVHPATGRMVESEHVEIGKIIVKSILPNTAIAEIVEQRNNISIGNKISKTTFENQKEKNEKKTLSNVVQQQESKQVPKEEEKTTKGITHKQEESNLTDVASETEVTNLKPNELDLETFTDNRDFKKYKMTRIGNQTWMAENLNFSDSKSKCYENNNSNCEIFGRLYTYEIAKSVCPEGWKLPSKEDLSELIEFIGGTTNSDKLKSIDLWKETNKNVTNEYGFSALPGGFLLFQAEIYKLINSQGFWWTSTENDKQNATYFNIYYNSPNIVIKPENKNFGLSVRCIKE
jgi:uncharacterized protein (TIGR02145 family)